MSVTARGRQAAVAPTAATTYIKNVFSKPYGTVSAVQAVALADGGAVLLDVREPHEWQAGHAPGARHIPLSRIPRRAAELACLRGSPSRRERR